jgi:hypothetical protein
VPSAPFVSLAPRCEDVLLVRALGHVARPSYAEVTVSGTEPSRCAGLDGLGWRGRRLSSEGALDAGDRSAETVHAVLVDVDDVDGRIVDALALPDALPWVVVIRSDRAITPASPPPDGSGLARLLAVGYVPALFDGASQYLVSPQHRDRLLTLLDHPAGPEDDYVTAELHSLSLLVRDLESRLSDATKANGTLVDDLVQWRAKAIERWSEAVAEHAGSAGGGGFEAVADEIEALKSTLSWRITRPLRAARTLSTRMVHRR